MIAETPSRSASSQTAKVPRNCASTATGISARRHGRRSHSRASTQPSSPPPPAATTAATVMFQPEKAPPIATPTAAR